MIFHVTPAFLPDTTGDLNELVGGTKGTKINGWCVSPWCGVINFIHMCFPQMAGILQLLDFGCRTNMTNIYECCSIANDALYLPCVVSLTNSKNDVCTRTHAHTENYDGSCPFSIPFIYIFCCFLLSNSSNCCSRGTIFGAGALRLHPTKENTAEHLTKQGLCWR